MPRTSDSQVDPCIVFEDVRKTFTLRHGKFFKEAVIAALTRKNHSTKFNAVDDLSFEVYPGEAVAVLGRNGSGKSTTLKLLSGVLRPDAGWIGTQGRVAGLLEVGAGFHPDLTGRDNVYLNAAILGMSKQETDERFDEIVEFAEIGEFIDTEVKRYSSGMYSRLGFAVAVHTELDVLLVDEVLSVGDAEFREKCNAKMKELQQQGKTMFIVSHNAGQVKQLCQRGIVLDHGKKVFDGPIAEAVEMLNPKRKPKLPPNAQRTAPQPGPAATPAAKVAPPPAPRKLSPVTTGSTSASKPTAVPTPPFETRSPEISNPMPEARPEPRGETTAARSTSDSPTTGVRRDQDQVTRTEGPERQKPIQDTGRPKPHAQTELEKTEPKPRVTTSSATPAPVPANPAPTLVNAKKSPATPGSASAKPPADQPASTPESSPDTLQARLATMNRLKERKFIEHESNPSANSTLSHMDEIRNQGPKHGA